MLLLVVITFTCLLGITGNILAVTAFQRNKKPKTSTSLLFQALAIADIVLLITFFAGYLLHCFLPVDNDDHHDDYNVFVYNSYHFDDYNARNLSHDHHDNYHGQNGSHNHYDYNNTQQTDQGSNDRSNAQTNNFDHLGNHKGRNISHDHNNHHDIKTTDHRNQNNNAPNSHQVQHTAYNANGQSHHKWVLQYMYPHIFGYVPPLCLTAHCATVWITVLVGLNRYFAICHPFIASQWCALNKAKRHLAIVVVCVCVYNIPRFASSRISTYKNQSNDTIYTEELTSLGRNYIFTWIYYYISVPLINFLLPLGILIGIYIQLSRTLKVTLNRQPTMQYYGNFRQQRRENKITRMLIVILLVFMLCQTPACVTVIFIPIVETHRANIVLRQSFPYLLICSLALIIFNSSVNFVVYIAFNRHYRRVMTRLCFCQKKIPIEFQTSTS